MTPKKTVKKYEILPITEHCGICQELTKVEYFYHPHDVVYYPVSEYKNRWIKKQCLNCYAVIKNKEEETMKESEFQVGDRVVCILDQRFIGKISSIEKHRHIYLYDVHWEGEVPRDTSGGMFFGWQLKKIEEEKKECWIDIMPVIVWSVVPNVGGYYLKGHYKNDWICYLWADEVSLCVEAEKNYRLEKSGSGRYFKILKKDC